MSFSLIITIIRYIYIYVYATKIVLFFASCVEILRFLRLQLRASYLHIIWSGIIGRISVVEPTRVWDILRGGRSGSWFKPFPHRFPPPLDFTTAIRVITAG